MKRAAFIHSKAFPISAALKCMVRRSNIRSTAIVRELIVTHNSLCNITLESCRYIQRLIQMNKSRDRFVEIFQSSQCTLNNVADTHILPLLFLANIFHRAS